MKSANPLVVTITVRDREGREVGSKQVVTFQGLLARAHDEGLRSIDTQVLQFPSKENGFTTIVRASITTSKGTFAGIGDASPENVGKRIVAHSIRMAETRAKARALRDAVNIGVVALEELDDLVDDVQVPESAQSRSAREPQPTPQPISSSTAPARRMDAALATDAQRRMLFRLATLRGATPDDAQSWLEKRLGGRSLRTLSKAEASELIDRLQNANAVPEAA